MINTLKSKVSENKKYIIPTLGYTFLAALGLFIYDIIAIVMSLFLRNIFSLDILTIIFFTISLFLFGFMKHQINKKTNLFGSIYSILIIILFSLFFLLLYQTSYLAAKTYIDMAITTISDTMYVFMMHVTVVLDMLKVYMIDFIICYILAAIVIFVKAIFTWILNN